MPAYRYLLCDLLTDQRVATLPLTDVTFDRRISRVGSFQGTLSATTPDLIAIARLVQAYAGRCALWVFRDNVIWWGGIVWTPPAQQDQRGAVALSITGATFDSYLDHRRLYADRDYDQVDAGVIIPDLWRAVQADTHNGLAAGNIGVTATDQPIGYLLDRTYSADDLAFVGPMVQDIGNLVDGPEHTIDVYLDPTTSARTKRLRLAKTLGIPDARTVFQRARGGGGNVLSWTDTVDATDGGTTFTTRGNGFASDQLCADDLLAAGWPLLDVVDDRTDIDDDVELTQQNQATRAARAGSIRTRGYTVRVHGTDWTPNRLGDPVRIKIDDAWHNQTDNLGSGDLLVRPVGVKVTAAGTGVAETVELLFGDN